MAISWLISSAFAGGGGLQNATAARAASN